MLDLQVMQCLPPNCALATLQHGLLFIGIWVKGRCWWMMGIVLSRLHISPLIWPGCNAVTISECTISQLVTENCELVLVAEIDFQRKFRA